MNQAINLLKDIFNQRQVKFSYFLPIDFYKFNSKVLTQKQAYLLLSDAFSCGTVENGDHAKIETIKIPKKKTRFSAIEEIYNNCPFFDLLLHGSYADGAFTKMSDVDDIVIIKREVFQSYKNFKMTFKILRKLNLFYQKIDPLQHHGHWIFFEDELMSYNQSIMPVSVFKTAQAVSRDLSYNIKVEIDESQRDILQILRVTNNTIKSEIDKLSTNKINLYYLKDMISCISLSVPLLFQLNKQYLDKKTAIDKAEEILHNKYQKTLTWASRLRIEWGKLPMNPTYSILRFLSFFCHNRNVLAWIARKFPLYIDFDVIKNMSHIEISDLHSYSQFLDDYISELDPS